MLLAVRPAAWAAAIPDVTTPRAVKTPTPRNTALCLVVRICLPMFGYVQRITPDPHGHQPVPGPLTHRDAVAGERAPGAEEPYDSESAPQASPARQPELTVT